MRNALLGYSYQQYLAYLFLAKMDVERDIDRMTLEADVNHQFDDISLEIGPESFYLQIKDFENIDVNSIAISDGKVSIGGKSHKLSGDTNIIFFRYINIVPNTEILGFPAFENDNVFIVSLNRDAIGKQVQHLYRKNHQRKAEIDQYFDRQFDRRELVFEKHRLPIIAVYNTKLTDKTVKISRKLLEVENILFIEGKPGIGKTHLVEVIQEQFKSNLLYRFWISSQDTDYHERLRFGNFLSDLSKKLFHDYKDRTEDELIDALASANRTLIIDGLDHVENYNPTDLDRFISFIERAKQGCKVIVLSRPLIVSIPWGKQILTNWNEKETRQVLEELYLIDDYSIAGKIYDITTGYPILVSYVAQQYKLDGVIDESKRFDSISSYYHDLLKGENGKRSLALFLCSRSYFMASELKLFLSEPLLGIIEEFITEHPFLFEIRLNRISLFHDSLLTYLRNSDINYQDLQESVNQTACDSLLNGEKRFQSRFGDFNFSRKQIKLIVKWYCSIKHFKSNMIGVIDYEAVRELYAQIREKLSLLRPDDLEVLEYYDLTLITNMVLRDHVSHTREFQYTYFQALQKEGIQDDDITSNQYLFTMWYYFKTNDATLLLNRLSDDHYGTDDFYTRLEQDIDQEKRFSRYRKNLSNRFK